MDKFTIEMIGYGAGIFTAISMLPQLIRIIKTKEAEGLSILTLLILLTGLALWTTYGVFLKSTPIIVTNAFSFCLNLLLLFFRIKYGNKTKKDK